MLQTLLRAALANLKDDRITVVSAGTGAASGEPASPGAQRAMQRRGLSLADHRSTLLSTLDLKGLEQVWCMTPTHAAAVRGLGIPAPRIYVVNAAGGGVPDPWGGDDHDYEDCAQVLELAARDIAQALTQDPIP